MMRTEQTRVFQRTCLALAILSLSACASSERFTGLGASSDADGATGSMASEPNALRRTREAPGHDKQDPDALLDEVDLALMEEDAELPAAARQEPELAAAREVTIVAANFDDAAKSDYLHTVTSQDTLWSIARRLTGDPGNWQQIARINSLGADASVRAGQELRIPRELISDNANAGATASQPPPAAKTSAPPAVDTLPASTGKPARVETDTGSEPVSAAGSTSFTLQADETLWELAKRATGDATLWKAIAEHNSLTDEQVTLVQAGQTILVPVDITRARQDSGATSDTAKQKDDVVIVKAAAEVDQESIDAAATLLAEKSAAEAPAPEAPEALEVPAPRAAVAAADVSTMDDISDEREAELESIMVSGTYYPKAVYNKADFSSSLLMRVSPGTALKVAGAQGPWFKVETDKGTGYMHSRDIR